MKSLVVMSLNPLTRDFAARIEAMFGAEPAYYNAADLRRMSLAAGLRELLRLRPRKLVVAIESEASRSLIAPLSLAAACTRARAIVIVWPDLRVEALRRPWALGKSLLVLRDTLRGKRALARWTAAAAELDPTAMARRVRPAAGHRVLYLDMNIALSAPVGGAVGHTAGVIDGLLDHGYSVDYASVKPLSATRQGASWLQLEPTTLMGVPTELNYYPYADLAGRRIVREHRADPWSFIYQRFSLHNFLGAWLGKALGIPVVLEFNGSEVWAAEHWGSRLALQEEALAAEKTALAAADLVVTVSDPLVEDLRRRGVPDERILIYPNCVDPRIFDPRRFARAELQARRGRYGIAPDALVVGFIGTFGQWHGVDFLAECVHSLVEDDRVWLDSRRIHFMLVGDGLKMPMVRQIAERDPVRRYVTLTGLVQQSEAAKYLACADLLVSPHTPTPDGSEFFGSPTKLFEYMAMERPIVAAALGQIGNVIAGRGATKLGCLPSGVGRACGITFEPGNHAAFNQELRRMVEDRTLAAECARAARAEVLARYTWNRHVAAILEKMAVLGLR
jgi:glycosyltransferase involved in cell wall biosynthesis